MTDSMTTKRAFDLTGPPRTDMEKLLREFFALERELDREVDPEIVRRAKEIPEWLNLLPPIQPAVPRGDRSRRERRRRETGSRRWWRVSRSQL